jgi:integrase
MARSVRSANLETRSSRLKLSVARKPVFVKVAPRIGLGYRRNSTAGTWVMRVADGRGGNWTKAIGTADDFDEANGASILDFWQAQARTRALGQDGQAVGGDITKPVTVGQALEDYETDLNSRGGDTGNASRARKHITAALVARPVVLLTSKELSDWRNGLVATMARASVNRTCAALKAALNLAADHDRGITSRDAWETGLSALPDAEQPRNVILPEKTVLEIVEQSYADSDEFGLLVEVSAVTGARSSQIARLEVQDLQANRVDPRLMMPSSKKGKKEKKITHRPVPIPAGLAARLQVVAEGRPATDPLLLKPSGARWRKSDHSRPFARAAKRANADPKKVTIYALRHTNIVRQILEGVPLRVVAVNHDTSVTILERTYSRHIADPADSVVRKAVLDISRPLSENQVRQSACAAGSVIETNAIPD